MAPHFSTIKSFFKIRCCSLFLLLLPFISHAKIDSIPYLSLQDTIFIQVNDYGIKTHHHILQEGQTLYSLGKFYQISTAELYFFNPKFKNKAVTKGQKIIVPIPNRAIIRYQSSKQYDRKKCIPVYHIVKRGETFYRLHKVFYEMPAEELMKRNNLSSQSLKEGQRLHIGWLNKDGIPPSKEGEVVNPILKANLPYRNNYFQQIANQEEWKHKGLGMLQTGGALKAGFIVLHDHAKLNSYIRITNPMARRTIYAKVVGRIPAVLKHKHYGADVVLAYTKTIADALGVIDPQFFADIRFIK